MELNLPLDFKDFLKLLNEKKVKYLLIGGYAVGYHGYPRATDGIEVNIIDLPHLKTNKKAAGRLKDLADLENLP